MTPKELSEVVEALKHELNTSNQKIAELCSVSEVALNVWMKSAGDIPNKVNRFPLLLKVVREIKHHAPDLNVFNVLFDGRCLIDNTLNKSDEKDDECYGVSLLGFVNQLFNSNCSSNYKEYVLEAIVDYKNYQKSMGR